MCLLLNEAAACVSFTCAFVYVEETCSTLLLGFLDDPSYASPSSGSAVHPWRFTDLVQEVAHGMAQGTVGHSNQDVEAVPLLMLPPSEVSDARRRAANPLRDGSDGGCGQVRAAAIVAAVGTLESS